MNSSDSTATIVNAVFSGNTANQGGGFANLGTPTTVNCSFSGNTATAVGGGAYNRTSGSVLNLQNCALWNNSDNGGTDESAQVHRASGSVTANYSCIQGLTGGLGGTGNIGTDPLFVDADGDDNAPGTALEADAQLPPAVGGDLQEYAGG